MVESSILSHGGDSVMSVAGLDQRMNMLEADTDLTFGAIVPVIAD